MSNAPGRGAGRQPGRGRGRDLSSFVSRGVIPTIGAYLQANDGVKSNLTLLWCDKIKEYAIANFATGVRRVMGR